MPLRDHFHPPLSIRRHWHAFQNAWATNLAEDINLLLPRHFFAEPNVQFGIEIDVAAWDEAALAHGKPPAARARQGEAAGATWQPSPPLLTLPMAVLEDVVEIAVFESVAGPELVGASELVSPANKDRPDSRDAFVAKCKAYVQRGIGLIIVDVVTDHAADLHAALLAGVSSSAPAAEPSNLHASAYRPLGKNGQASLQVWHEKLVLGGPLPVLPLWLTRGPCVPVDFERTYETTSRGLKLDLVEG